MSNVMRHRYGYENPRLFAVDSATVIEIGDLLWLDTDDVKPAADLPWNTDLATTQADFSAKFAGVAMEASPAGHSGEIRVATTGVFEFDCDSATFEVGDMVSCAKGSGDFLENQKVVAVSAHPIGKVARREPVAGSKVLVEIRASVVPAPAS
ncbi:MAG: hypothetical protein J7L64_02605 [Acidobacteria bacterium]|nr:hypothetical protein [Acidobacteriota bacterium]